MKKNKKLLIILAIAVMAVLAGIIIAFSGSKKIQFKTAKIQKGEITQTVRATGNVNPVTTIIVGTRVSGTIVALYADYNSKVKKGQLIAQIDSTPFENELKQAEAELLNTKATLFKAEVTLKDAERTLKRKQELFKRDLIARSELDDAETAYNTARAQYEIALAQVKKAEAGLRQAKTNLGYTRIVSPVDGVVIAKNVEVGQTVAASFQTPTLFTIAPDLTKMQVDTNVDEADISKIKTGMEVNFTVDAYPDKKFKGIVSQIRLSPTVTQNVVTYNVVISFDNSHLLLKPGMTANVTFVVNSKENVIKIPNSALRFRMPDSPPSKQQGVWVIRGGKPVRINVKTGISDGEWTELIEGDLKEGEEVIIEIATKKQDGATTARPPVRF
ncbi:MAG: efflux RND transporter periplasmic adaptor subunit [Thermodesulfovibrio sp.]|jgi:HlyD family secretion protein|uniref:efflux RND transporter periplasmic adaptor subunit n=1 Tax=unclassified Thermodesulfovibrio TaxID=2645936 RepID=UPI00083A67DA|nr:MULTISPECIES: efflux RND transporter periplasmic adaptor subunit [unclassified Thermodesulfovibrio]MDI1472198.1 efflux RND transporter periplasmic adaptor subunit [Thermodesulfovibrio sp. 1176]MDI6714061.1 efflux RND transporter periplasmic adaptor subunit [Thermodesulfovibrio sp.]ODA43864.1 Macrolide-specific efflux protein MacA [Thermodesulfovibrio sp. N1]